MDRGELKKASEIEGLKQNIRIHLHHSQTPHLAAWPSIA